jgi:ATP-dependent Clp protease ATP-binding subunit ClpC
MATVALGEFNYMSSRAQKARIGHVLGGVWIRLLLVMGLLLGLAGVGFLVIGATIGWVVLGIAVIPLMIRIWYLRELHELPAAKRVDSIDDVLATDVLGQLPKQPTPHDIAVAVGNVSSGQFFGVRFGITPQVLINLASTDAAQMPELWQAAGELRERLGAEYVSGAILAVVLVRLSPEKVSILAHLQLDDEDLEAGIRWHLHLRELVKGQEKTRRTGGVARDWSFGFTPMLERFGQNISEQVSRGGLLAVQLEAHQVALEQMVKIFSESGRQNAVLVGQQGAGKTTIVHAFAEKLLDAKSSLSSNLKFRQVVMLDAGSLLAAAPGRGELEQLVEHLLGEAFVAKNIIICLDNAQLFFEEGVGSVDLSNMLLPILEAGRLRIILTMDEQRFLQISQRNAALVNSLNRISVGEATKEETFAVMQDQLIVTEFRSNVTYMYQALQEAYRLSERYVHDLVMPGRAFKLLESSAGYADNGLVTIRSVQQAIEQTMDVKVGVASAIDEREKLLNLEDLIHKRMINQTRAVGVVSDALRRARAGVRNQNRPIGAFLFLGPTGVGKTELAKALADAYFGGEERLIRLDLNEYVRPEDVSRLIADGANDPTSLTAQVMKQPFSVVLLDEIEKAHPDVLTTLLQLLDEGILRDIKNREISFRDTIVIATSNAGADRIREYIERGYELEQFEAQFVDELISSNQFRPEFLNRFDEIVTFRPLGKEELLQVVDLILVGINKTLALQKVSVSVADDAKRLLVERGYDPRLGARPMRRIVQRAVENTVAKQLLAGEVLPGSTIDISLEQVEQILGSQQQADTIAASTTPSL